MHAFGIAHDRLGYQELDVSNNNDGDLGRHSSSDGVVHARPLLCCLSC